VLLVHWTQAPVLAQVARLASPRPAHSVESEQPAHLLVPTLQMGVVPAQLVLAVHSTQAPLVGLQTARLASDSAAHWALAVHATHLLVAVSHRGVVPPHVVLSVHSTQAPVVEQIARLASDRAAHWALAVHATHLLAATSHCGVPPEQSVFLVHWTQVPEGAQTARFGSASWAHSLEAVQGRHLLAEVSQRGVAGRQSRLLVHSTHLFLAVLQAGVADMALHAVLSVHCTHCPAAAPAVAQAGLLESLARHWLVKVHAAHLLAATSQMGIAPEQVVLSVHSTHRFFARSHARTTMPWQLALLVHSTHLLLGPQTGVPAKGLHEESSTHWTHWPAAAPAVAHTGFFGSFVRHWLDAVQAAQVFDVQIGAVPGHWVLVVH
jgi:hypothetical protein